MTPSEKAVIEAALAIHTEYRRYMTSGSYILDGDVKDLFNRLRMASEYLMQERELEKKVGG